MINRDVSLEKKFKNLLREKGLTVRAFCKEIGMSTTNLYDVYKRNSIDTKYLALIEKAYEVPQSYFVVGEQDVAYNFTALIQNEKDVVKKFQDDNEQLRKEMEALRKENEFLMELVDSKNMLIESLKGKN